MPHKHHKKCPTSSSSCPKKSENECGPIHVIRKVPITIRKSGKYCVKKDLIFDGPGVAITVTANNVTINFNNHSLTINDSSAVGVLASGVREFTIENDIIQTPTVSTIITSAAIQLTNCEKVALKNIFTLNTFFGVSIQNSDTVSITQSKFKDHIGGGAGANASFAISVGSSNNVVIEKSTVTGLSPNQGNNNIAGTIVFFGCIDCRVSNCQFTNAELLAAEKITGLIVENCTFEQPATGFFSLLQLGLTLADAIANDVIVRGCTFMSVSNTSRSPQLIIGLQGSGCLIENCVLDRQVHNGDGIDMSMTNVTIRNCVVQVTTLDSASAIAVFPNFSTPRNVVIDNCQLTGGGAKGGQTVFLGGDDCVIKNSEVSGGGNFGIEVADGIPINNVAVINNIVRDCGTNGIQIDGAAIKTRVEGNKVFSNTGIGIFNASPSSQIFFNTSCGNTGGDCFGVDPRVVQTPGDPAVAGSNVCCSSTPTVAIPSKIEKSIPKMTRCYTF